MKPPSRSRPSRWCRPARFRRPASRTFVASNPWRSTSADCSARPPLLHLLGVLLAARRARHDERPARLGLPAGASGAQRTDDRQLRHAGRASTHALDRIDSPLRLMPAHPAPHHPFGGQQPHDSEQGPGAVPQIPQSRWHASCSVVLAAAPEAPPPRPRARSGRRVAAASRCSTGFVQPRIGHLGVGAADQHVPARGAQRASPRRASASTLVDARLVEADRPPRSGRRAGRPAPASSVRACAVRVASRVIDTSASATGSKRRVARRARRPVGDARQRPRPSA